MKQAVHVIMVVIALGLLVLMDARGRAARAMPDRSTGDARVVPVNSQKDIYFVYRELGLRGARVVHLNRFLNLVDYLPKEENVSMPFPVRVGDVRPLYEKGLDPHNWLFIANRTGLVRTVTVVLPDAVWRERVEQFDSDFAFTRAGGVITGYTHDMPMMVTTLDALPVVAEPVVVNVDAGYFVSGEEPDRVIAALRQKCPDIRLVVVSDSRDEPEIGDDARRRSRAFEKGWASGT